jgi:hypothetical protein
VLKVRIAQKGEVFGRGAADWSRFSATFASKRDRKQFLRPKPGCERPPGRRKRCRTLAARGGHRTRRDVARDAAGRVVKQTQPGLIWARPPSTRREAPVM